MDLEQINNVAVTVHLMALAFGLGLALASDINAAKMLFRPLYEDEIERLHDYHRAVFYGLGMFWMSGLVLFWLRTGLQPENISPKLMTKLLVVLLLTTNAIMIGRVGLWFLRAYEGFTFGELPMFGRLKLGLFAGLSTAGWTSALLLGTVQELKTIDPLLLGELIGAVYTIGILGGLVLGLISPILSWLGALFSSQVFRERRNA